MRGRKTRTEWKAKTRGIERVGGVEREREKRRLIRIPIAIK